MAIWLRFHVGLGKPLERELAGSYSARRGSYRILYDIDEEKDRDRNPARSPSSGCLPNELALPDPSSQDCGDYEMLAA